MKDNSLIIALMLKMIAGEALSSSEQAMLDEWLKADEGNLPWFNKVMSDGYLPEKVKAYDAAHEAIDDAAVEAAKYRFHQKLAALQRTGNEHNGDVPHDQPAIGKRIQIKRQWKLFRDVATSAAAVLILAAATFLLLKKRKQHTPPVVKVETVIPKDIAPGSTKARLTLANGKTLVLDSNVAGRVAQQGVMEVSSAKGILTYKGNAGDQSETLFNTLTTVNGESYAMVLADGSKAWLNTGASIRYPVAFTGNERRVSITGEVYFEVEHNTAKPFIVHVTNQKGGEMDVQVLGTHFNINAYDDEVYIKTTLLQGSVKILQNNAETLLKPGEQAQVSNGVSRVVNDIDVAAVTAWKDGIFSFNTDDVTVVMRQLSKWYDIEVVYESTELQPVSIRGETNRNQQLSQTLRMLEYFGVHCRLEGRKLVVLAPVAKKDK